MECIVSRSVTSDRRGKMALMKGKSVPMSAVIVSIIAVIVIIFLLYWRIGSNYGSYYGGVRTVPKRPPIWGTSTQRHVPGPPRGMPAMPSPQ